MTTTTSKPRVKDYYQSSCCEAEIKNIVDDREGTGYMECTACRLPCDITLTKKGVEASVASNHSLSYPVDRELNKTPSTGKIEGERWDIPKEWISQYGTGDLPQTHLSEELIRCTKQELVEWLQSHQSHLLSTLGRRKIEISKVENKLSDENVEGEIRAFQMGTLSGKIEMINEITALLSSMEEEK